MMHFALRQIKIQVAKGARTSLGNFEMVQKVVALRMIVEIYDKGLGVPADKEKAANLYQEATRINDEWINDINNLQLPARFEIFSE